MLRVGCGIAIGIGVDTEDGEVPRMTWVPPVVRISSELPNGARGCAHEANIRIDLLDEEQVLIPVVEGLDLKLYTCLPLGIDGGILTLG